MAQSARKDVRALEAQIEQEESNIQLLKADIAYLERPDRLAELGQTVTLAEPLGHETHDTKALVMSIPLHEPKAEEGTP